MEPVIFLDRDGVISEELGEGQYISQWDHFRFIPGSLEAIRLLTESGFKLFIISNQGGVGKGLIQEEELQQITERMLKEITRHKGKIEGVYYCVHAPEAKCLCRKPAVTLFKKAVEEKSILWEKSVVVGDALRDLQAGWQLGCQTVLVLSGRSRQGDIIHWTFTPHYVAENLLAAVPWILSRVK